MSTRAKAESRLARRSGTEDKPSPRSPFQRDRDRILFSTDFHRLAEITQVTMPDGYGMHNRLTHTLEVAQIGQRMAQRLVSDLKLKGVGSEDIGQILDPDVVEAACLAHDLGHPPFGHVAEDELNKLGQEHGGGGFEGNAQSFRIVTRLSLHNTALADQGIDLTAATLNAILKYPWLRTPRGQNEKHHRKFGAYHCDQEAFNFARSLVPELGESKTVEAQVMDYADAIAYAVHDLMDFYKAGLLPLEDIFREGDGGTQGGVGIQNFLSRPGQEKRQKHLLEDTNFTLGDAIPVLNKLRENIPFDEAYMGTFTQQADIKEASSRLINRYITKPRLEQKNGRWELVIDEQHQLEINFLKELIWFYIINRPQLGTQQHGMRYIIRQLFHTYLKEIELKKGDERIIPAIFRPEFDQVRGQKARKRSDLRRRQVRLATDLVAILSDRQARTMYARFMGMELGRITDSVMI